MSTRHRVAAAAAAVLALALVGCGTPDTPAESSAASDPPATPAPDPTPTDEALTTPQDFVTGLDAPWSIAFLGDTVIISERDTGHILEVVGDTTRVIGTVEDLFTRAEAGLLGLAVDDRARLYAYSTGNDGNRIQRFTVTGEPGALALGAPETILDGIPHAPTHDGGRIAFGPDGMLYATTGDAGDPGRAQNRDDLAGKILRMTPDGDVPPDNPFAGSLVYSYGHRNPQGIAWAADGTLFAAEFGQNTWDELNIITPAATTAGPPPRGSRASTASSIPCSSGRPQRPRPAASRSPATRSTSRTCAESACARSPSPIRRRPKSSTSASSAVCAMSSRYRTLRRGLLRRPRSGQVPRSGSSRTTPTDAARRHPMTTASSAFPWVGDRVRSIGSPT
ncbi:PQQ-dependent sugar dehydrogenase [Microbacterium sp. NIBRBAC000506063]|uniref:PQQ-dependent sugar dehydrogenase n=1 Tax=Microbacterium sp. NIBRBAC000506063 TaxID=2734618 RepID=UPI002948C134|nr:PQQ-dependent sugar dehydrogenase [Microbacterium sp. NIBRBAC000506063]